MADCDELEYKYFLEGISAICERKASEEDLDVRLFGKVTMRELDLSRPGSAKMYYLSRLGTKLASTLNAGRQDTYEATLFWLILRSSVFDPLIQKFLCDSRPYRDGLADSLVATKDAVSRRLAVSWIRSFGLNDGGKLDVVHLSRLLSRAVVMELNEMFSWTSSRTELVQDLCRLLSDKLFLSESAIDFSVLLDFVYSYASPRCIEGFPSGRGNRSLPSKPLIQILEFKRPIPIELGRAGVSAECVAAIKHQIGSSV